MRFSLQVTKSGLSDWTVTPANRANFSGKQEIAKSTLQMKNASKLRLQGKQKNIFDAKINF